MSQQNHTPPYGGSQARVRAEGDGMDFEALQTRDISLSPASAAKRYQNLNHTPRAALFTKEPSPKYIPHEPVKGAVRPVKPHSGHLPWQQQPQSSGFGRSKSPALSDDGKKSKATLNAPVISSLPLKGTEINDGKVGKHQARRVPTDNRKREVIKNINVPVYNAPGHLSHNSYLSLNKDGVKSHAVLDITPQPEQVATKHEQEVHSLDMLVPPPWPEEREVEGQSSLSDTEVKMLKDQIKLLEDNLQVQTKVNADLKKLLVASVGDDLHHKVESLVRTKAHLATEIGGYTQKIGMDHESLDELQIQADKWRTKYMAGRVLIWQISQEREAATQQWQDAQQAMRMVLQERQQLHDLLLHTHRYLKLVRDSFDPSAAKVTQTTISNDLELANINLKLSEAVKYRLLGNVPLLPVALDAGVQNHLTPAQNMAYQMLSKATQASKESTDSSVKTVTNIYNKYSRFHPQVRYENVTFNCCRKCKGEIQVV